MEAVSEISARNSSPEMTPSEEFSFRTRAKALQRFQEETFDLLVVGGGIIGAGVARDAITRGLKVALVERKDFAYGTSSRTTKLIHGGLRYLENLEFGLVFESLAERSLLLKTAPNRVRPLSFYLPVYEGDLNGPVILNLGLWLYDLLALFRTPAIHRRLSKSKLLSEVPFLKAKGLRGGFQYYDASMWDDVLAVETVRAASGMGAAIANYAEAVRPIWEGNRISGFVVRDLEDSQKEIQVKAHRTVICAGPWTDQVGQTLSQDWQKWLKTSKGVHLIFDLKRIPIPGALVMSHPSDGRIAFVIPRPDYGTGVVIVGTTDGPAHSDPDRAQVDSGDVRYLMDLLTQYFPELNLKEEDILSAYVGVRPLMEGAGVLQKVSREHHIAEGPGGTVVVAGGKYTTHRKMAEQIVDFTLKAWRRDLKKSPAEVPAFPQNLSRSDTRKPLNSFSTELAIEDCKVRARQENLKIPEELLCRYGAEALGLVKANLGENGDPAGFPYLKAQLKHGIQKEMVMHLEDFYLRRIPLYASRKDHGLPWAEELVRIWAEERSLNPAQAQDELKKLKAELMARSEWEKSIAIPLAGA